MTNYSILHDFTCDWNPTVIIYYNKIKTRFRLWGLQMDLRMLFLTLELECQLSEVTMRHTCFHRQTGITSLDSGALYPLMLMRTMNGHNTKEFTTR